MAETLLLLSTTTGYQAQAFAEAARRLGMQVVFGTDRCRHLEDPWRNGALALRFEKPQASAELIAEYARRVPVHAVVGVGDKPTLTAALACRALGLPWHRPEGAEACHNKLLARERYRRAGIAVPEFTCLPLGADPRAAAGRITFPCVLKPVSLSASRGVIRADNPYEFTAAFRRIAELLHSPEIQVKKEDCTEQILVEAFIPGREFALEAVMERGRLRVLALFDKPDPLDGPFFEETIYVTPSRLPAADQAAMTELLERAVRALGLFHGPLHAEFRLNQRGPWLLEVAARPIGGLCARALRFSSGSADRISLEELIIRNARGQELKGLRREDPASGVMMIPVPKAGIFEGLDGMEEAAAVAGIAEIRITAKLHQKLLPWPEGASYPGFIFARAPSPEAVERALRDAHARLHFRISEALPVV